MEILTVFLRVLKLPLKLLISKKKSKKTELEKKQLAHVRNFAPTHYSWQQQAGKKLTKKQRKYSQKKRKRKPESIKTN